MSALLQLLHLGRHGRLVPFLARARDGAFVGDELVELAPDRGRVVVAGDLAFDFFEVDGAVVALFGGGGCGGRVGVDVLFVGCAFVFGFVFGRGFGVGGCSVGGGAGAAGTTRCFGHFGGWMVVGIVEVGWGNSREKMGTGKFVDFVPARSLARQAHYLILTKHEVTCRVSCSVGIRNSI